MHTKIVNIRNVQCPPGWVNGDRVGLMTWWLRVQYPVEANFPAYFRLSLLPRHVRKVVGSFGKKAVLVLIEKARKHTCVIDRNDMSLAVKVALNLNTTNQQLKCSPFVYK